MIAKNDKERKPPSAEGGLFGSD